MTDENGDLTFAGWEQPLHSLVIEGDQWWACGQPERPPDGGVVYDLRCRPCQIAAEASLHAHPDQVGAASDFTQGDRGNASLADLLAEVCRLESSDV